MKDPAIEENERAFETLGLAGEATAKDVRRAYRSGVRAHPPDRDPESFERIRRAYELLAKPEEAYGRVTRSTAQLPDVELRPAPPVDLDRGLPLAALRALVAHLDVSDLLDER